MFSPKRVLSLRFLRHPRHSAKIDSTFRSVAPSVTGAYHMHLQVKSWQIVQVLFHEAFPLHPELVPSQYRVASQVTLLLQCCMICL